MIYLINGAVLLASLFDASRELIDFGRYIESKWFTWGKNNKLWNALHQYPFWSYLVWTVIMITGAKNNGGILFALYWIYEFYQWRNLYFHILLCEKHWRKMNFVQWLNWSIAFILMVLSFTKYGSLIWIM